VHDFVYAESLDEAGYDEIAEPGETYAYAGIVQGQCLGHSLFYSQSLYREISSDESKRRAEECRHLELGDAVERQGSDTGKQQG